MAEESCCDCHESQIAFLDSARAKLLTDCGQIESDLADETAARTAADTSLQSQITPIATAVAALDSLTTQHTNEISALEDEDDFLPWDVTRTKYGAVMDSAGDASSNATAVQQALSDHGKAYIPEGVLFIGSYLSVSSGDELYGAGMYLTEIRITDDNANITATPATESYALIRSSRGVNPFPDYTHHDGIWIHDLTINGNADANAVLHQNAAISHISIYGSNTRLERFRLKQGRAGVQKEAFWINVSGTYDGTYYPAKGTVIKDFVIEDVGGQSNGINTNECSLILVSGYIRSDAVLNVASDLARDTVVSGGKFRDLEQNGTTQRRVIHGIAVMGENSVIEDCFMCEDIVGQVSLIHYNSGSVHKQKISRCFYNGEYRAVACYRGIVGGAYNPSFTKIEFENNDFESTMTVCQFVSWNDGDGFLDVSFNNNRIESTGSGTAPIALESREEDRILRFYARNNELIGEAGSPAAEAGFSLLITNAEYPAAAAVPASLADRLLIGDNRTYDSATPAVDRATNRAFRDGAGTPITWTNNSNFSDIT